MVPPAQENNGEEETQDNQPTTTLPKARAGISLALEQALPYLEVPLFECEHSWTAQQGS
jgi:hypothetical protein